MTFCLAFAGQQYAFVAGDTRAWSVGPPLRVHDGVRKVAPLIDGWCVSANRVDVSTAVERALKDCCADDVATIAARLTELRQTLHPKLFALPSRELVAILGQPTTVWVVAPQADAFTCRGFDWLTGAVISDGENCVIPYGADPIETARLVERMIAALPTDATRAGYLEAMRRVAQLFHDVASRLGADGPVSDTVEIGGLWRDASGQIVRELLPPTATTDVSQASDADIETMLVKAEGAGVFRVGMLGAIRAVASGLAKLYFAQAAGEIAKAIAMPFAAGQHLAAAAKFALAGAAAAALAGSLAGAASNTAGGGAGGGAGGSPEATARATEQGKPPQKIVLTGDLWNVADPAFVDKLAAAFSEATDREVIVQRG